MYNELSTARIGLELAEVAAGHSVDPAGWRAALDELLGRIAGRFGRVELRRRARAFVLGLLADLPRKNCWTIAEHAGDPNPDRMQHLPARPQAARSRSTARVLATEWVPRVPPGRG
jgi:hypothetical protein